MAVPWSTNTKSPFDCLTDLEVRMTFALQELSLLENSRNENQAREKTRAQYESLIADLISFYDNRVPGLILDIETHLGEREPPMAERLAKTYTLVLLWAMCLLLFPRLSRIYPDMEVPQRFQVHNLRHNILTRLQLLVKPEAGWLGINMATFPLLAIYFTLEISPLSSREEMLLRSCMSSRYGKQTFELIRTAGVLFADEEQKLLFTV
jgi:hypothetical protein